MRHWINYWTTFTILESWFVCLVSPEWLIKKFQGNRTIKDRAETINIPMVSMRELPDTLYLLYESKEKRSYDKRSLSGVDPNINRSVVHPLKHSQRPLPNITSAHYKNLN